MSEPILKKDNTTAIVLGALAIVVVLVILAATAMAKKDTSEVATNNEVNPAIADGSQAGTPTDEANGKYKNGEYTMVGTYTAPSGEEKVGVTLTLKDDIITAIEIDKQAVNPISQTMQEKFESGYKAMVVGKKIDDVRLDKVSGSSLTPKGFNDALAKIKAEAAA